MDPGVYPALLHHHDVRAHVSRATTTVFAWVLLIPILSHLLIGRRLGLLVSAVFMVTAAVIFFFKFHDAPELMQPLPIANMGLMSLTILAFSIFTRSPGSDPNRAC